MPAPVMTTTFLAFHREFAISCNWDSQSAVTCIVGISSGQHPGKLHFGSNRDRLEQSCQGRPHAICKPLHGGAESDEEDGADELSWHGSREIEL